MLALKNIENPFLPLTSEAKYWIGYIFADGHVAYDNINRIYSISLFSKNEFILRDFLKFLGNKSHFYKRPTGICQVIYYSKEVTKWFMDTFNIPVRKALVLNPTINIDWDILHGYFDGDGCIRFGKDRKWERYEVKFTTGSLIWANRIRDFLSKNNINTSISLKGNAFDVLIYKKSYIKKLFNNFYKTGTSRLEYKYQRFVALVGDNYDKQGELLENLEGGNLQLSPVSNNLESSETNS